MYRSLVRKVSVLTLCTLLFTLLSPIAAFAYTYSLKWDYPSKTLSGDIYVQDPSKVTVEARYTSGSSIVLNEDQHSVQTLYDDKNVTYSYVKFRKTLEKLPDTVIIKDGDQTYELPYKAPQFSGGPVFFDTGHKRLSPWPRIQGEQYLDSYPANTYIPSNSDLVSFTPAAKGVNAIEFMIPPYGATENINSANLQTSDFILLNESTGIEEKLNLVTVNDSNIVVRAANQLQVGSRYKLKFSGSSGGNEILVPEAGTYWTYLNIGTLPANVDPQYVYVSVLNEVNFDNVTIKGAIEPETPIGIVLKEEDAKVSVGIGIVSKRPEKYIVIDRAKLESALALLPGNPPEERLLTANVEGDYSAYVELPGDVLLPATKDFPDVLLTINSRLGRFQIPLGYLDIELGAKKGNVRIEDTKVILYVTQTHAALGGALSLKLLQNQSSMIADPLDIGVMVEAGNYLMGRTGPAALRIMQLSIPMDTQHMTGVGYDVVRNEYRFVPSVFKRVNGSTQATIKHTGELDYSVAYSNKSSFDDTKNHWARSDIELLASKLILKGVTPSRFAPDDLITRSEFATLLVRSIGLSSSKKGSPFRDVSDTDWYAGAVKAAADSGLITGSEDGRFDPSRVVTREEMAVMISRAVLSAGKKINTQDKASVLEKFTDREQIHSWAQSPVAEAVQAGIISGKTKDTFAPNQQATRAEAAVMLKRFLQYVEYIN